MIYNITMNTGAMYKLKFKEVKEGVEFEHWLTDYMKPDMAQWEPGVWINRRYIAYLERTKPWEADDE